MYGKEREGDEERRGQALPIIHDAQAGNKIQVLRFGTRYNPKGITQCSNRVS